MKIKVEFVEDGFIWERLVTDHGYGHWKAYEIDSEGGLVPQHTGSRSIAEVIEFYSTFPGKTIVTIVEE